MSVAPRLLRWQVKRCNISSVVDTPFPLVASKAASLYFHRWPLHGPTFFSVASEFAPTISFGGP